jgi:hypothetical protein
MLGHCFGVYPTPGGAALFCFGYAALRVTVPARNAGPDLLKSKCNSKNS